MVGEDWGSAGPSFSGRHDLGTCAPCACFGRADSEIVSGKMPQGGGAAPFRRWGLGGLRLAQSFMHQGDSIQCEQGEQGHPLLENEDRILSPGTLPVLAPPPPHEGEEGGMSGAGCFLGAMRDLGEPMYPVQVRAG